MAGSPRKLLAFLGALVAFTIGGVALAPAAFAHHPEIRGEAACDSTVTFTSTAWNGSTDAQRTNPSIAIAYAVDNGSYVTLAQAESYRYDAANGFTFSGTISPPAGWTSLKVRATALGEWGSGAGPGDARTTGTIQARTDCTPPAVPAASVASITCATQGAVVRLTNPGGRPVDFTITGGSQPQVVTVPPGGTQDVTVGLPADTPSTVTVTANGMVPVSQSGTYTCANVAPSVTTTTTAPPAGAPAVVEAPVAAPAPTQPAPPAVLGNTATAAAPAASGELPRTGSGLSGLTVGAIALLGLGVAAMVAARRRTDIG